MKTATRLIRALLMALLVSVFFLVGCGGDEEVQEEQRFEICDPTEGLDEGEVPKIPTVCSADIECPCGMHCDLGECVSQCQDSSDCDGDTICDSYGRCQVEELVNKAPRQSGDSAGSLHISDTTLSIYEYDQERTVRLGARHQDIERLRVYSEDGIEFACDGGSFGTECRVDAIETGATGDIRLELRATDSVDFAEGSRHEIRVFADDQRQTISITARPVPQRLQEVSGTPGVYRGYAWPEGSGFVTRGRTNEFADEIRRLRIPVEITVYPGDDARQRIARLDDDLGLLFPDGETVGLFERDTGTPWELSTPRQVYSEAAARPHLSEPILVNGQSQSVKWSGPTLSIEHRSSFEGVITGDRAPYVDWQIATTLVETFDEDTELDVPTVPDGHAPVDTDAQIANPLVLEELVGDYFGWSASDFDSDSDFVAALLCNDYPASPQADSPVLADLFGNKIYEYLPGVNHPAGELACDSTDGPDIPPKAFELLNDSVLDVYENMKNCFDDWERADQSRQSGVLDTTPANCIDEPRFIKALTQAQHADRARALGDGNASDRRSSALAHRLMQQWLSVHTFAGREFAKVETFNVIVPADQAVDLQNNRLDIIERITRGFDLFLTPRVASAVAYLPTEVVRDPDYRATLVDVDEDGNEVEFPPQRTHDQSIGIPVAMMQAYAEQLSAISDFLEDVQYARSDIEEIEGLTEDAIAQGMLLMAIAQGLYDEMRVGGQPTWENEWQIVRQQVGSRITAVMNQLEDARNMVNPLGIADVDLPLYRIGDQQSSIQRFSAISDFLVGVNPGTPSVASSQVDRAADALELSRDAWLENVERDLGEQLLEDEQARRIETIRRNYGGQINGLCGGTGFDSLDVLDNGDAIDSSDCYLADHCEFKIGEYTERISSSDVGYDLCTTSLLRKRLGNSVTSGNADLDETLDILGDAYDGASSGISTHYGADLPLSGTMMTVEDASGSTIAEFEYDPALLDAAATRIPEQLPTEITDTIQQQCQSHRQYSHGQRPNELPDSCRVVDDCPVGFHCDNGGCESIDDSENDDPDCYEGALGEAALEVRSLASAVDISRAKLQEYSDRYNNAMESCMIAIRGNELTAEAQRAHNITMTSLNSAKLVADTAVNFAAAGRQSSSLDAGLTGGATAAFAVTEALAKTASDALATSMEEIERYHEATIAAMEAETEKQLCFNDAEMELIGAQGASIDLQRATQDLAQQIVAFENQRGSVDGLLREGRLELQTEVERTRAPIDIDFWIDERIQAFERYMRAARRSVYLAVMAVEYEYQFSSAEREAVLAAETPEQLDQVLANLRAFTMTGNVGGSNPSDLLSVVSLRDHILQLGDRTEMPPGFYKLSSEERFQALLSSPQMAVYEDGQYVGQQIPFQLAPMGEQGLGDYQGISLLAGTDCAERLWSANISLQGEDLYNGDESSFSRVVLKKRNTFFSQWCNGSLEDEPLQMASTRPSRNLFIDPYARDESTTPMTSGFDGGNETDAFSNARVSAYFNVERSELDREDYSQGETTELAGRGLYGDYALFFPAGTLSRDGSTGLQLDNLEDVWMRFDYVSVSQ